MMKGVDVVIAADSELPRARDAYRIGKLDGEVIEARTPREADEVAASGRRVITDDYRVVTDMRGIDVVL